MYFSRHEGSIDMSTLGTNAGSSHGFDGSEGTDPARLEANGRPPSREITAIIPELALYPDIVASLQRAFESPTREIDLVVTDLDNSLIPGTGREEAEIKKGIEDAHRLVDLLDSYNGVLVCVTGSSWDVDTATTPSVSHRMSSGEVPSFLHAVVADGGMMALGKRDGANYEADTHYDGFLRERKSRFPAQQVYELADFVRKGLNRAEVAQQLGLHQIDFSAVAAVDPAAHHERVYFQPHVHPHGIAERAKVSLYFYAESLEERDLIEAKFRHELGGYAIVCCEERDFNNKRDRIGLQSSCPMKFCLDITPVHKGTPVKYFADLVHRAAEVLHAEKGGEPLKITTWYCGDAANDLVGMRRREVDNVVMVAQSSAELLRYADDLAAAGKRVFIEKDATRSGAATIIKALLQ